MKVSTTWMHAILHHGYPPKSKDYYTAVERMAKLGFRYQTIEAFGFRENNVYELRDEKAKLKKFCDDLGVIVSIFPIMLPGILSSDAAERERNFDLFKAGVETAVHLETKLVHMDTFSPIEFIGERPYESSSMAYDKVYRMRVDPQYHWADTWQVLVDVMGRCNEELKKVGIGLLIEPRVGEIISNSDSFLRVVDALDDDNFGVVLEFAHQKAQKEIMPLAVEKLGSMIKFLHVADSDGLTNYHLMPGTGTIDFEGTFQALAKHGFDGYAGLDFPPSRLEAIGDEYNQAKDFIQTLAARYGM